MHFGGCIAVLDVEWWWVLALVVVMVEPLPGQLTKVTHEPLRKAPEKIRTRQETTSKSEREVHRCVTMGSIFKRKREGGCRY